MADKAIGAPGFRAVWTEVQDGSISNCHNSFFRMLIWDNQYNPVQKNNSIFSNIGCKKSQFCIPMDLKCDGSKNCGIANIEYDHSDEEDSTCTFS